MGGFEVPAFTFWKVVVTAIGASILWARWNTSLRLRAVGVSKLLSDLGVRGRWFTVLEFVSFVGTGTLLAILITDPQNARQALASGLAWTGLLAQPEPDDDQEERE